MTNNLLTLAKMLLALAPFVLFAILNMKVNLSKEKRSRQILMPVLALIYSIVLLVLLDKVSGLVTRLLTALPDALIRAATWFSTVLNGRLSFMSSACTWLSDWINKLLSNLNISYILFFVLNVLFMLAHIILKRILITFMQLIFKTGNGLYERLAGIFYEQDEKDPERWFVKKHFGQARTLLKTAYIAALVLSCLAIIGVCIFYRKGWIKTFFFPVFSLIIVGELFFAIDGLTKAEQKEKDKDDEPEEEDEQDLRGIRPELKRLFENKLDADDMTVTPDSADADSSRKLLKSLEESDSGMLEAYAAFMNGKAAAGLELDHNYLTSGRELLTGKSILFNNPFYYDLIPYVFYPINRTLLKHGKVLIVLGRHKTEQDAEQWCRDGLTAVNNIPVMWNIGVLNGEKQDLDVGIITRSSVHDLKLHEANAEFFESVGFVVLIEPSRLLTTAQVGLNSIVRCCKKGGQPITYCSMDKNCDGLVDSLSHILMTSLTEVSATNRHSGLSTYMCWAVDDEHMIHRMLPNISRYLGFGTELSFAGLRSGAKEAYWFGGDAFPVSDTRWIASQYYFDLLKYAGLPTDQEEMDAHFKVSPNLWHCPVGKYRYMAVEDEAFNMFEVRRNFSTRAVKQGFVNILSSEYLLKDYMVENSGIFRTDPKAIPYVVADYAHTGRNVMMRICLRLCTGFVSHDDLIRELMLVGADTEDPVGSFWHGLCTCYTSGEIARDCNDMELLTTVFNGQNVSFTSDVIETRRRYSNELGSMENVYYIRNDLFARAFINDLRSASYIAEDENGESLYLGAELRGHIFQKYCPGQFFVFDGKYYEMLRVTQDGNVLVRRAADHITGRPGYRQVRNYTLTNVHDSDLMGDRVEINGMRVSRQYADVSINTPAYWDLPRYNDFNRGSKVSVNGIPERVFLNKQILRIDLPKNERVTEATVHTLALLINETFRTLFAENQDYISAVVPGEAQLPLTYSLSCEGADSGSIFIIEDSQLDIGLLEAVRRNIRRILFIACDYLEWHLDALEKSEKEAAGTDDDTEGGSGGDDGNSGDGSDGEDRKKKKGLLRRILDAIKNFFRKLFGKKKKPGTDDGNSDDGNDGKTRKKKKGSSGSILDAIKNFFRKLFGKKKKPGTDDKDGTDTGTDDKDGTDTGADDKGGTDTGAVDKGGTDTGAPDAGESANGERVSFELSRPVIRHAADGDEPTVKDTSGQDDLEFEDDKAHRAGPDLDIARKPYHERYYLLYGGTSMPEGVDPSATLELLRSLGFDNGELKQARTGRDLAGMIENGYTAAGGVHICDFCGAAMHGNDYERLADGRERCLECSKTAIKTAADFKKTFMEVRRNLDLFFNISINVRIDVKMVNAKRVNSINPKGFVPTGKFNPRYLGYAQQVGNHFAIYLENGAPKVRAMLTMAHELTHIWQYTHWDSKHINALYGKDMSPEIYEGMATWAEIQYAYYAGETETAARMAAMNRNRDDEYGRGFVKYEKRYKLTESTSISSKKTPFSDPKRPL